MTIAAVLIFCLTYLLIASRRLSLLPIGRPAGALLGAVLMVVVGVLTPAESYRAIDHDTIVLLFGMMILTAYLEHAGFFEAVAGLLFSLCTTPARLLAGLALLAGSLSAFLVNDTVCLFLTPVVVAVCERGHLPYPPYLLAIATSANIGSAATLVGNPQNMIIGSLSRLSFRGFLARSAPAAAAGLALNLGLLWLYYRRGLPEALPARGTDASPPRALLLPGLVTLGVIAAFFAGAHLGIAALAGGTVLIVAGHRDPRPIFARVDWTLLVFFCGLFVVVAGLAKTGLVERAWALSAPGMQLTAASGVALFSALMTVGSNLVSNVPMVLLAGPHLGELGGGALGWVLLAFTTTVAGNLTLIGSVANIIVAEGARDRYTLGFWEYLRFGAVSTLLVLSLGVTLLWLTASR